MTHVNTKELSLLLQEASVLTSKPNWTKQDERRNAYLMSAISAVKAGASLQEIEQDHHNAEEKRLGLPITRFKRSTMDPELRAYLQEWQKFANGERRDMTEGGLIEQIGTYTSLGYFVPTEFFQTLFSAMAAHDALFDEDSCTVLNTTNGRPIAIGTVGDIEVVATVVGEAGTQDSTDIASTGHAVVGAYAYKSPRFVASIESFQDLEASYGTVELFKNFASDRLRRGIATHLISGDGTNKPKGLVPSLEALGVSHIDVSGSAANTGGPENGANSIGSKDLSNLYHSVNSAYRSSGKCAWLMNDDTLNYLDGLLNKEGLPLGIVKWDGQQAYIFGKPVKICPSMDSIGASKVPVIFGDLAYWVTRIVTGAGGDELTYIQTYSEAPGLAEQGNIGFRAFLRADGALAFSDTGSPAPLNYLRNAS